MSTLTLSVEDCRINDRSEALGDEGHALRGLEVGRRQTVRIAPPPFDDISDEAARAVVARWNRPCEGAFELLTLRFPHELAKLIAGVLSLRT
jgi:hypothetical protein